MTVGVVVFSYNRPKFLREALRSIYRNHPEQVVVCDDGSDKRPVIPQHPMWETTLIRRAHRSPELRVRKSNLAALAAEAVALLTTDYIAWLCDDDLMADGWLDHLRSLPRRALYIGDVLMFKDGDNPTEGTSWMTMRHDPSHMTTGNFVHRTDLPVKWPEDRVLDHDAKYVYEVLQATGAQPNSVLESVPALYYRQHAHNLGNYRGNEQALMRQFRERTME